MLYRKIPLREKGMDERSRLLRVPLILMFLGILLCGWTLPAPAAAPPGLPADLQALIDEALKANPEVKERAQLKTASEESVKPAGALDDPMFSFNILNLAADTFDLAQEEMTNKQLAISQKIPFPGKRRLRSEVAEEQARADNFVFQDKQNEIRTKVIQGYWGLALTYAGFDITQKNKQFWEQVVQVAETRYGVGRGSQADVLQAQVELGTYLDRLFQWRQRQESIRADLNALRSQPQKTSISRPQPLKPRGFAAKLDDLLSQAENQPRLKALKALVAKQDKAVELARKDYYPDFNVGLAYGFRERSLTGRERADFFTALMSINLPIWWGSKLNPKLREQKARRAAAQESFQTLLDRLAAAVKDRHAKLERLSQQIALYDRGLVPQARQAAEASLASYQVGTLDFSRLFQTQIAAYNAELQLQQYLKEFEDNWAELEWLVGEALPHRLGEKK
jgi:cobalt-zinc-cadmium efflux system outer membrane protein